MLKTVLCVFNKAIRSKQWDVKTKSIERPKGRGNETLARLWRAGPPLAGRPASGGIQKFLKKRRTQ